MKNARLEICWGHLETLSHLVDPLFLTGLRLIQITVVFFQPAHTLFGVLLLYSCITAYLCLLYLETLVKPWWRQEHSRTDAALYSLPGHTCAGSLYPFPQPGWESSNICRPEKHTRHKEWNIKQSIDISADKCLLQMYCICVFASQQVTRDRSTEMSKICLSVLIIFQCGCLIQ